MGPVINTRGSEVSPFFHPGHEVLYFSSNGHLLNFGEFDIYKSYRVAEIWDEPKNIGPLVNGQGSEFYFTIDYESNNLYYARSVEDKMGNLDLYSFPLPMAAQPLATTKLRGKLLNKNTGEPFTSGIVSIIDLDNGIEVAPKFLRPDGTFEFQLINNNNYLIVIQGDEFFRLEEIFFLDGDKEINRQVASISQRLRFESMKFDNGKAELKTSMFADLDKIIDFLLDNPDFSLKIDGHTDADGDPAKNLKLSEDRANAIKEYLVEFGNLDAARITATGYGSTRPIVEEKTEKDKQMNRRVEFHISKE
jgi:outer membrane protein OmpA-like peptidoglycan-associated protein